MMIDIIAEIAWELKRIAQNIKETQCVPDFLSTDIMEQGMRLQELYNELCSLEDQKSEIGY